MSALVPLTGLSLDASMLVTNVLSGGLVAIGNLLALLVVEENMLIFALSDESTIVGTEPLERFLRRLLPLSPLTLAIRVI